LSKMVGSVIEFEYALITTSGAIHFFTMSLLFARRDSDWLNFSRMKGDGFGEKRKKERELSLLHLRLPVLSRND
jgi:hypothetical protein